MTQTKKGAVIEKENNAANEVTRSESLTYENVKIVRIGLYTGEGANDPSKPVMLLTLDKKVKTFDKQHNEIESEVVTIKLNRLVSEVLQFVPELQLASALALNAPLNPQIVSLALMNATLSIRADYKFAGELREGMTEGQPDSTYQNDTWKRTIVKATPNINPIFMPMLLELIKTAPAFVVKTAMTMPQTAMAANPFGV